MRILVTAGPTCEDIDPVRYLTNRSSGKMGYAVAEAAARRGHEVVLVSGPTALSPPLGVEFVSVRSAAEMLEACLGEFPRCQAAVLAAAVADYRPASPSPVKIEKGEGPLVLRLERTEDIARRLGETKGERFVVGFALESGRGRGNAERKLAEKNFDAIVLNHPETFGSERIRAEILTRESGWSKPLDLTKAELASRILDLIEDSLATRQRGPNPQSP